MKDISKNNIRICFAAMVELCLCILFGLLPGLAHSADVPRTVTTASIVFTGLRSELHIVDTVNGLRYGPKRAKTASIVFTGLSFEPQSVKTGSIQFTGLGQETTLGLSGSKALLGRKGQEKADVSRARKFNAGTVKPAGKTKTMPEEAMTGFVPPSREKIKKNAGKGTTKTARAVPDKLGARLVLKDQDVIKSISLKANESFDIVFPVSNTGDTKSGPFQYAITCKVLRGGPKCPVFNMTRTVSGITAQKTHEIKLKGIAASPGEYEVSIALKAGRFQSGAIKRIRLKVEAANRTVTPNKGSSTQEDNEKLQIQPKSKRKTMRVVPVPK
jgi:hypothetical protein